MYYMRLHCVCMCRLQDTSGVLSQAFNHVKSTNNLFQNNL